MSTLVMFIRIKSHALSILKGKGLHKGMNIRRWRLLGPSWSLSVIVIAFHRKGAFSVEKVNISVWKVELRRKFPMCICCSVTVVSSFLQPHGLQKKKKKKYNACWLSVERSQPLDRSPPSQSHPYIHPPVANIQNKANFSFH